MHHMNHYKREGKNKTSKNHIDSHLLEFLYLGSSLFVEADRVVRQVDDLEGVKPISIAKEKIKDTFINLVVCQIDVSNSL